MKLPFSFSNISWDAEDQRSRGVAVNKEIWAMVMTILGKTGLD